MAARVIFFILLIMPVDAQAPWVGVWKLNASKSTAPSDRYKRVITKIEPWEDGLKVSYEMVGLRGGVSHLEWIGRFDGMDYPVEGADYIVTNAYTRLSDQSYEIAVKVEGALASTARVEVSQDGKTLTSVTTQKNAQGRTTVTSSVYDRQ